MFVFISTRESLSEFERLKKAIQDGKADEAMPLHLLLKELKDKKNIDNLTAKYPDYFYGSIEEWEMRYDIAIQVLQYEINNKSGRYSFEIVNYLLAYCLNPPELKCLFFLMHGFHVGDWAIDVSKVEQLNRLYYIVYSLESDLYESYKLNGYEIKNVLTEYEIPWLSCEPGEEVICILQIKKSY